MSFLSELGDFTRKKSVLVDFELFPQNELFGDKHMLVVPFYGKMIKNTILQMYTRNVQNPINCGF